MEKITTYKSISKEFEDLRWKLKNASIALLYDKEFIQKFIDKVNRCEDEDDACFDEKTKSYHLRTASVTMTEDDYAFVVHPVLTENGSWRLRGDTERVSFSIDDLYGDELFWLMDDIVMFVEGE